MIAIGNRYQLERALAGVKLEREGSEDGVADLLPAGSIVETSGPAQFYGMIEAKLEDKIFAVFEEDLIAASVPVVLNGHFALYRQHN